MTKIASVGQPEWIAPTLLNSWLNYEVGSPGSGYGLAGYYKDQFGRVYIKGLVASGTLTDGTVLFNLPVGYRPPKHVIFAQAKNSTATDRICHIYIFSSGDVTLYYAGSWVSLEGINFSTKS